MVVTLSQARLIINNYLVEMNLNPHNLIITGLDTQKKQNHWILEGEFQQGFMGDFIKFEAEFRYTDNTLGAFKIKERLKK